MALSETPKRNHCLLATGRPHFHKDLSVRTGQNTKVFPCARYLHVNVLCFCDLVNATVARESRFKKTAETAWLQSPLSFAFSLSLSRSLSLPLPPSLHLPLSLFLSELGNLPQPEKVIVIDYLCTSSVKL